MVWSLSIFYNVIGHEVVLGMEGVEHKPKETNKEDVANHSEKINGILFEFNLGFWNDLCMSLKPDANVQF